MDITTLITRARADGTFARVARNPAAQFGTRNRRLIGAEILPNQTVPENSFTDYGINYRTVIANAGTRYSPTQKKGGALTGSVNVQLAESDIASELTGRDYDTLLQVLNRNASMEALAQVVNFVDTTVNRALEELLERWRWQAIVNAVVQLRGDNEYTEDVAYSNPTGHRVAAGGSWSNNSYDPFLDIYAGAQQLANKGYQVSRMFASRKVAGILGGNSLVRTRTNRISVSPTGQIQGINGRSTLADVNAALNADGLPDLELYDLMYRTLTATGRFLPDTVLVMVATTGRDATLDLGDGVIEVLPDTLGYTGIGRATGQPEPGRVINVFPKEDKPPRIEAEGYQTALPVITEPEAIFVITGIA